MKQNLLKSLLFALAVLMAVSQASAHDFEVDGIYYNISGNNATVTYRGASASSYYEYTGAVNIPSAVTYNGTTYSVTTIGRSAFNGCTGLTSITIPNSVTTIGEGAFAGCRGLTTVTIPNSVTTIDRRAFYSCTGLTSVTINSVTSIGNEVFGVCTGLTSVIIGNSVTTLGTTVFEGCTKLKTVTINSNVLVSKNYTSSSNLKTIFGAQVTKYIIGENVSSIGDYAFYGCSGLTSVTIGNSVTTIGYYAFHGCTGLTSLTIGNSVTAIDNKAFYNCSALKTVNWNAISCDDFTSSPFASSSSKINTFTFGSSVEIIPKYLCNGLTGLTSISFPTSVTAILGNAFQGCTGLTSVSIPNSVRTLGGNSFNGCTGITSLSFGSSLIHINGNAFRGCTGLTSVTIPTSITSMAETAFNECTNLTSITWNAISCDDFTSAPFASASSNINTFTFGSSVQKIPAYLCQGIPGITSITIPESVTSIGGNSFNGCTGLTSVTIPNSVTTINGSAFKGCSNLTTVTLGDALTSIASYVFQNTNLKRIAISAMTPPTVTADAFSGLTLSNIQLSVPFDAHYRYYNHSVWKQFYYVHLFSGTTVGTGGFAGSGSGTESDPYLIFNPIQLYSVRNFTGHDGVVFKLMSDIDLTQFLQDNNPTQGWEPIGVQDSPFKGVFHGENHTISGLFSSRQSNDFNGLFGYVEGATIENLTINATTMKGGNYAGSLSGFSQFSTLKNITTTANVNGKSQSGGFVGMVYNNTINNCHHTGSVTSTGDEVGGFAGALTGTITRCSHEGNVSGQNYTGGFVGHNSAGLTTITCKAGTVTGANYTGGFAGDNSGVSSSLISNYTTVTGGERTGGFVGHNTESLSNVTSTGKTVTGDNYTGGFIGDNNGNITDAASTLTSVTGGVHNVAGFAGYSNATFHNITSTLSTVQTSANGYHNGGFVGYARNATMTNCKSKAAVTSGYRTGGFVGIAIDGITATDCYAIGDVTGNSTSSTPNIGGFIGRGLGNINITKCGAIGNVSGKADSNGASYVGGFIGYLHNDNTTKTISNCFAVGDVTATGSCVGGLVGMSWQANIGNSYYSGKLTGTNYAGGIIGSGSANTLSKNYANGSISGTQHVGGITGYISTSSSIKSCVAAQDAINATNGTIGRIYGSIDGTSSVGTPGTNEANRGMTTMNVVSQGQQLTVEDGEQHGTSVGKGLLKYKSTYQGINWNFSTDWTILETESYPYKPSQCAPPVFTGALVAGATNVTGKCASGASVYVIYDGNTYQATVSGTTWTAIVPALQSGASIKAYAVTDDLIQSYFVTATVGFEGDGTEGNPYLIYTADDLAGINSYSYYKVMNDIDLTSWINANSPTNGWIPIGKTGGGTMCQLDGDGHIISGLWTNNTGNNTGLISSIENATIKNLTITVANGKMVKGTSDYVGIVVGKSTGSTFENIDVQGNVSGANYVASIAGYADGGTFTNCNANGGQITATGGYVACVTGYATNATFTNCSARDITGSSKGSYLAGVDAYAINSTFTGCSVDNVSLSTNNGGHVGGIAGYSSNDQFVNCDVAESLFTGTGSYAGGIAAGSVNNSTFENCSVTGTTIGGASYVGGITGQIANPLTNIKVKSTTINATGNYVGGIVGKTTKAITNCYADVALTGKDYIGGITGHTSAKIEICYSQGSVETTDLTNCRAGGIVGYTTGNITNCYSSANARGGQYAGGIAGYSFGAIAKCYSSGDLYATNFGAGIVGYLDGASASVNNCFAINNKIDVSDQNGVAMRVIGGFKNGAPTPQTNNYALKSMVVSVNDVAQTIYDDLLHGIGVTQNVLETQATYVAQGWDFTDVWGINEGNGYPYLLALVEQETPEFTPGDVNDDGTINVSDYVATAGYILEQDPQPFIFAAADLDENNDITVSDLVGVAYLALTYEGSPMLAPAISMSEAPSIAMTADVNMLDNNRYEVAINMSNNIALSAMQMDLSLPQGMTLVDASLSDRASASHQVAFNQLSNGDYRLLASSSACKSFSGNDGIVLTLSLAGTPSYNGILRNIQLASPHADGYSINDIELNFNPTGVDFVTTTARIYSEGGNIIIISPNDGTAQIVLPNGMNKTVRVVTGRNVYQAPFMGIVIVKMGNEIKKMRF